MRTRTPRVAVAVAALVVAAGLAVPTAASASTSSEVVSASRTVPTRDLGNCWAQAGRVVGGGVVAIGSTVLTPWMSPAVIAAYLGAMANEPQSNGYFTC